MLIYSTLALKGLKFSHNRPNRYLLIVTKFQYDIALLFFELLKKKPRAKKLSNCDNWPTRITLLATTSKTSISRVLFNKGIQEHVDKNLRKEHVRFRRGRSCNDQCSSCVL